MVKVTCHVHIQSGLQHAFVDWCLHLLIWLYAISVEHLEFVTMTCNLQHELKGFLLQHASACLSKTPELHAFWLLDWTHCTRL